MEFFTFNYFLTRHSLTHSQIFHLQSSHCYDHINH